jgi:hypothetical protein
VTVSLPKKLLDLTKRVQSDRQDPTYSDTVRVLLLQALGVLGYLSLEEAKALGIKIIPAQQEKKIVATVAKGAST